ncbi:MAG: antibiotic biosynthesis monooxygenase family protein [Actinoplanes sp.]
MEPVTMIGIFSVGTPERQDDMIAAIDTTGAVMRDQPGFRGAAVYASTDGTRVVNISHWNSTEDLLAARENPAGLEPARRMFEIAVPEPIPCVLRSEFPPPSAPASDG